MHYLKATTIKCLINCLNFQRKLSCLDKKYFNNRITDSTLIECWHFVVFSIAKCLSQRTTLTVTSYHRIQPVYNSFISESSYNVNVEYSGYNDY